MYIRLFISLWSVLSDDVNNCCVVYEKGVGCGEKKIKQKLTGDKLNWYKGRISKHIDISWRKEMKKKGGTQYSLWNIVPSLQSALQTYSKYNG